MRSMPAMLCNVVVAAPRTRARSASKIQALRGLHTAKLPRGGTLNTRFVCASIPPAGVSKPWVMPARAAHTPGVTSRSLSSVSPGDVSALSGDTVGSGVGCRFLA